MRTALALAAVLLASPALADAPLISDERQLTFEGRRAGEGYFSADGREMVFQSEREPGNPFYQMYVMNLETGDIERVSPGVGKTTCGWIHPDGRRILFASTQTDPAAREKMQAENDFRASGQTRRYAWDYDPAYELQEHDRTTGSYRNLSNAAGYDAEGAYSPDGSRIVFASNRAAYGRALTEEEKAQLERDPAYFMDLYVMDADGRNVRRLTDAPGYDGGPFWSADGRKITWRRFSEDGARAEIMTINADGSGEKQITRLGALSWAPFFHPSGEYIVFASNLQGFANFELYMVDAEGRGEPVRVTTRDGFDGLPTFSPDGRTISWTSNATADGTSQIFLADWNHEAALSRLAVTAAEETAEITPATPDMAATAAEISADDLRLHVGALASEEMAGRLTGTEGEQLATAYVADAFRALGLEPAGDDGGYFEAFDFTAGVALAKGNELELRIGGKATQPAVDKGWRPLAFSRTGPVERAGVAFAGFGIVAPEEGSAPGFNSYGEIDVEGRWVLVWRGMPNEMSQEGRVRLSRFADLRYKASVARSRGAVGLIVAPAPGIDYADELPRLTYESTSGAASLPGIAVDRATANAMLAATGPDFEALAARLDRGETGGAQLLNGVEVAARIALDFERRQGRNVLARLRLGGDEAAAPVVVGAHVDHLGRGETSGSLASGDEQGQIHYGADDNASGVAALIEIAQHLAAERKAGRLEGRRDIVFAAWSGEELGLLGASHHVEKLAAAEEQKDLEGLVAAYLNMDMIGRLREKLALQGVGSSSVWSREIERRNAVVGLAVAAGQDTYLPTDATPFYLAKVPILSAFTGAHEDYHKPSDTAEKLNYEGMQQIARLMGLVTRSLAVSEARPDYIAVSRPEGQRMRRTSGVYLGTVPDYAKEGVSGVPLSGVVKDGPAEKAGLAGGDVLVELAGAELQNIYDYVRVLNGLKVGETVEVVIRRDGERLTKEITPAARE